MDTPSEPVLTATPESPRLGLAIACLVLGILACIFSLLVFGAVLGIIGLILGAVHIGKYKRPGALAWWGVGLCAAGILGSIAMSFLAIRWARQFTDQSPSGSGEFAEWKGVAAPDLTLTALDGTVVKLKDLRGKRIVLDFWATWCGPCVREIPHFIRLRNGSSAADLVIVGISSEDAATLTPFIKQKRMNYPVVSASRLPSPYNDVRAIPTTFFIDRDGIIQSIIVGYHEFDQLKKLALPAEAEAASKPAPAERGGQVAPRDVR